MIKNFFLPTAQNKHVPHLLRKRALSFYTAFLLIFNIGFGYLLPHNNSIYASSITANNLISLTNTERQLLSLNSLTVSQQLTSAAYAKAQDMLSKDYWDHFGPNGETPWQFMIAAGYDYQFAGENLAKGFSSAEGVHQAWMASPTHRDNILNRNYKEIGIAVVEGELEGEKTTLVVQMFGATSASTSENNGTSQPPSEGSSGNGQVIETGSIKSISIVKPANNSVLNEAEVEISGEVKFEGNYDGSYKVIFTESNKKFAETESDDSDWKVDENQKFTDGKHTVVAYVEDEDGTQKGGDEITDKVTFTVDDTPPALDLAQITVSYMDTAQKWDISFVPNETISALLKVNDESQVLTSDDQGRFQATILSANFQKDSTVLLSVSDSLGNSKDIDLTNLIVVPEPPEEEESSLSKIAGVVSSPQVRHGVNLAFAIGILSLVALQIYAFYKMNLLHTKVGYISTATMWAIIVLAGMLLGKVGEII